eukprot:CAMPEP_0179143144 /NCGR_PEP_ID=MMETSP0796-20121207/68831_1 /TAXON_ID=73915 /ORGANISM="Pyrodinium bahamense, Strain pbaha01" /LENGTH=42 /DNA_ID= /DNA_START= /DNA_END= /DNA_ORIENTATION=
MRQWTSHRFVAMWLALMPLALASLVAAWCLGRWALTISAMAA